MRIGELIRNCHKPFFSLEFYPPASQDQMSGFYGAAESLGKLDPLFVSVTYGAGGASQQKSLAVTSELAKRGFTVMSHLTCVGAEPDGISSFIKELQANGIDNILALRGDPPKDREWNWSEGYFHNASDLVLFIRRHFPEIGVGVAVYPAPHPESPTFERDRAFTALKLKAGAEFGISQLFFDVREYEELMANLHKAGIDIPIIPGILPVQSLESLKRVLSLCGANIPGNFFLRLEKANEEGGREAVREAGIEFAIRQIHALLALGAPGIHLYTLNQSSLCSRIIRECRLA